MLETSTHYRPLNRSSQEEYMKRTIFLWLIRLRQSR
jgi:hypothetical protein